VMQRIAIGSTNKVFSIYINTYIFSSVEDYQKCRGIAFENQVYNPALYCYHKNVESMHLVTGLPTNLASQFPLPCSGS